MSEKIKVVVTGAAGQIGYSLIFRLASGEVFGRETRVDLSLLEVEAALPSAKGVIMELEDCAFSSLSKISLSADPYEAFKDADWALLVGSFPRKAGMERGELLTINGKIFIEQGKALDEQAKETCKVLVVGNPCNTNAYIAKETCRRVSPRNFFAMTMLDQYRAQSQLALKAGVAVSEVKNMAVWGNHSATQFPDFYHATISGRPAPEVINNEQWLKTEFLETVQKRGAAVIQARGKSSAASAANAVVGTVQGLERPTPKGEWFSVAVESDGSYGIDPGIIFGFPVVYDGRQWKIVQDIKHDDFAREKLKQTLQELRQEREEVQKLLK